MANGIGRVGFRSRPTLWNGLLAYFTGDNTPNDILGNYSGTLVNGTTFNSGINKKGFSFDGVNDSVNYGNVLDFDGSTPFSWSFWLNFSSSPSFDAMISKYNAGVGYYITMTNTNKLQFGIGQVLTSNAIRVYSENVLTTGNFYHCVVTYDGSKTAAGVKIYIDASNTSLTTNYDTFTGSSSNTQVLQFGRSNLGGNYFNGILDEVGVWNRVLTPTEITELYNSGNAKQHPNVINADPFWNGVIGYYTANETTYDLIGYNNGTLVNGVTYDNGIIDKCFSFNSSLVQSITTKSPVHDYSTNTTYNMWIKPSSLPGFCMFLYIPSGIQGPGIGLRPGGNLTFFRGSVNGDAISGVSIVTDVWQMITIVYRPWAGYGTNNVDFYINGSLVASKPLSISSVGGNNMFIGSNGASNGVYNGLIDEISIWNTDLSPSKITELYNSGNSRQYPN